MFESRVNRKTCPKCKLSTALASKSCSNEACGHSFFQAKQAELRLGQNVAQEAQLLRRTGRVRRRNPQFNNFEADIEKETETNVKTKSSKRGRSFGEEEQPKPKRVRNKIIRLSDVGELDKNKIENPLELPTEALSQEIEQEIAAQQTIPANTKKSTARKPKPKRRRRAQNAKNKRKIPRQNGGGDKCALLSKEKQELAALFLSEINRKMVSVAWRF